MKQIETESIDAIYKNGVLMLDTLAEQNLINKQNLMFYRDHRSHSVVFSLVVPSWQQMPIANGTLNHVHLWYQPVKK